MVFLAMVFATILDPFHLVGYALSGWLIPKYWWAVTAGVSWQLVLTLTIRLPLSRAEQSSALAPYTFAALVGAFLATSTVYFILARFRKAREKSRE